MGQAVRRLDKQSVGWIQGHDMRQYTSGDPADRANGITMVRRMPAGATSTSVPGGAFSLSSLALMFRDGRRLALRFGASAFPDPGDDGTCRWNG